MGFVVDNLFDDRKFRMQPVINCFSHECLAIQFGQSLKGEDVVQALSRIVVSPTTPVTIKSDNVSEIIRRVMDRSAYEHGAEQDFSRPGKPTDNAVVESFTEGCAKSVYTNIGF